MCLYFPHTPSLETRGGLSSLPLGQLVERPGLRWGATGKRLHPGPPLTDLGHATPHTHAPTHRTPQHLTLLLTQSGSRLSVLRGSIVLRPRDSVVCPRDSVVCPQGLRRPPGQPLALHSTHPPLLRSFWSAQLDALRRLQLWYYIHRLAQQEHLRISSSTQKRCTTPSTTDRYCSLPRYYRHYHYPAT